MLYPVAMNAPCTWPIASALEVCGDASDYLDELTPETRTIAIDMATEYLWRWTDQRFGLCETTIRPCRRETRIRGTYYGARRPWEPVLIGGQWYNITCGRCHSSACGCTDDSLIELPGPIASVSEVWLGGEVLEADTYLVLNGNVLARTEGRSWPFTNDATAPRTDPSVWEVTYLRGEPVPAGGRVAARLLAVEFAKAMCRDKTCKLPNRWQTITRDGVSVTALDAFDDITEGHTGIWAIDSWVASVTKRDTDVLIMSPDFSGHAGSTRTWPL